MMSLSSADNKAITKLDHATVRKVLAGKGWHKTGSKDSDGYEYFDLNKTTIFETKVLVPPDHIPFDSVSDEDLIEVFAEVLDIGASDAIALLSGKQTTTFQWHSPDILPPPNVPLIVDLDGKHRAAEFTGDLLKRLKFCDGSAIVFLNGKWSYKSGGIRAIAWEVNAEDAIAP